MVMHAHAILPVRALCHFPQTPQAGNKRRGSTSGNHEGDDGDDDGDNSGSFLASETQGAGSGSGKASSKYVELLKAKNLSAGMRVSCFAC